VDLLQPARGVGLFSGADRMSEMPAERRRHGRHRSRSGAAALTVLVTGAAVTPLGVGPTYARSPGHLPGGCTVTAVKALPTGSGPAHVFAPAWMATLPRHLSHRT
jgi:hypothetical protein